MCVLHISVLCTYNTPSRRKNQNVISTKILTYFLSVLHNIQYTIFRFSANVIIYWHAKHLFLCIMHTHFCVVFIYFARAVNVCYFNNCIIFLHLHTPQRVCRCPRTKKQEQADFVCSCFRGAPRHYAIKIQMFSEQRICSPANNPASGRFFFLR